jgi:hypothetical protein
MADKTTIAIEVEVEGVEPSINSVKDLKNAIKAAKDEQVKAAAAFGQGSEEYVKASKKLGELKDSMDDLNDSTQSLRGSGVESLSSSFGMLGEGFKNLDLDKIKTGFKGIGQAMSAVPLMLLVTGITMLAEKFGIFEMITDAVVQVLYAFTDAIGLTNKADEKAAAEMIENAQKVQKAKEAQYDKEIKLAKAAGQDVKQLELDKLKSSEEATQEQINKLEDLKKKKGKLSDDEQKQYDELQEKLLQLSGDRIVKELEAEQAKQQSLTNLRNLEEKLRVAGLSDREKEIETIKKQQEALIAELDKNHIVRQGVEMQDTMRYNEDLKKINELTQKEINEVNFKYGAEARAKKKADDAIRLAESDAFWKAELALQEEYRKEEYILNKKAIDDQLALEERQRLQDEAMIAGTQARNEQARLDKLAKDKAAADKELADLDALEKSKFDIIRGGLDNAQKLSDLFFDFKTKNLKKGSKEEEEAAKKQFQVNKAISLTLATNNGVEAVLNAFKSGQASPITPFFPAFPFVQAGLAGVFAAANIAKIASSKFQPSGGGGGGGGDVSAPMPSIPAPPTIATSSNNTNQSTLFDESGQNLSKQKQPQINVTATVGVDEIANKTNRVSVLEQQSTF